MICVINRSSVSAQHACEKLHGVHRISSNRKNKSFITDVTLFMWESLEPETFNPGCITNISIFYLNRCTMLNVQV